MTTYLALDPGLTTGVAWYDDGHFGNPEIQGQANFGSLEIEGRDNLYQYLKIDWHFPKPWDFGLNVLVAERWDVRADTRKKTNQEDPRMILGYLDWVAWQQVNLRYIQQRPVEAKQFATDKKLRELGWYTGGPGHADDAARHLLVALVKDRVPEILEAIT